MAHPPIPTATRSDLLRWLLRRLRRVRVVGASMTPTLLDGEVVLVDRNVSGLPDDGAVVVVRHPQQPTIEIVKRIEFTDDTGMYLRSDNADEPEAADSRRFGMVPVDHLVGHVISKIDRDEAH